MDKDMENKIKELEKDLHEANIDKEKYFIEAEGLAGKIRKLKIKYDGDIKLNQDLIRGNEQLKQNKFKVIFDYKIENNEDITNMLSVIKWRLSKVKPKKNKYIQIGIREVKDE